MVMMRMVITRLLLMMFMVDADLWWWWWWWWWWGVEPCSRWSTLRRPPPSPAPKDDSVYDLRSARSPLRESERERKKNNENPMMIDELAVGDNVTREKYNEWWRRELMGRRDRWVWWGWQMTMREKDDESTTDDYDPGIRRLRWWGHWW